MAENREQLGDYFTIEDDVLDEFFEQTGRRRTRREPERPPVVSESIILDDVRVRDGVEPSRQARERLSSTRSRNRRRNRQESGTRGETMLSRQLKSEEDTSMPGKISLMDKTLVRMNDVLPVHDASDIDAVNYYYAPIIPGFQNWQPIVYRQSRDEKDLFSFQDGKIGSKIEDDDLEPLLSEFDDIITFPVIISGFIIPGQFPVLVMLDCINYNGKYIGDMPYEYRLQRLHEVSSLLFSDSFKMFPLQFKGGKPFIEKQGNTPFIIIDPEHVHSKDDPLLTIARIVKDGESIDPTTIVFGKENEPEAPVKDEEPSPATVKPRETHEFEGKRVYITGRVPGLTKEKLKEFVEAGGVIFHPRVNSKLDLLVIASNPGEVKIAEAKTLDIPIMGWDEFVKKLVSTP